MFTKFRLFYYSIWLLALAGFMFMCFLTRSIWAYISLGMILANLIHVELMIRRQKKHDEKLHEKDELINTLVYNLVNYDKCQVKVENGTLKLKGIKKKVSD